MNPAELHRASRKPFVAAITLTDLASAQQTSASTRDLSVYGCFVATETTFDLGAKVRLAIVHAGAKVLAFGRVLVSRADGMGIVFTKIAPDDEAVLERWMSALRDT